MHRLAIGCLCLILSSPFYADEMKMPIGQQGDYDQQRPPSGMTTDVVQETFGAPENVSGPIGEPPITVWRYTGYSVYFEYDLVIHTVLHKT